MSRAIQQEVDRHFSDTRNRQAYEALLDEIQAHCEAIGATLGAGIVRDVYSRRDKQKNDPFKSQFKIARALVSLRAGDPTAGVTSIQDIIGQTATVYYPDQIDTVTTRLLERFRRRFRIEKNQLKADNGYYARHIVVVSNRPAHADRRCEVQVKTMVHDAWAAKMHDLTYKPQGQTDQRLSGMMQVLGAGLQAVEEQSVLLRQLIHELECGGASAEGGEPDRVQPVAGNPRSHRVRPGRGSDLPADGSRNQIRRRGAGLGDTGDPGHGTRPRVAQGRGVTCALSCRPVRRSGACGPGGRAGECTSRAGRPTTENRRDRRAGNLVSAACHQCLR